MRISIPTLLPILGLSALCHALTIPASFQIFNLSQLTAYDVKQGIIKSFGPEDASTLQRVMRRGLKTTKRDYVETTNIKNDTDIDITNNINFTNLTNITYINELMPPEPAPAPASNAVPADSGVPAVLESGRVSPQSVDTSAPALVSSSAPTRSAAAADASLASGKKPEGTPKSEALGPYNVVVPPPNVSGPRLARLKLSSNQTKVEGEKVTRVLYA